MDKSPGWVRAAQIGLGLIILILSIMVLINPLLGDISVIFFLAFVLLFAGIEKVVSGFIEVGISRFFSIGLGIIVIIVSLFAMTYPLGASIIMVLLFGIALLIDGIARIIHGARGKQAKGWLNNFSIGVGILSIVLSMAVIAYPGIGLMIAGILIGMALLITSTQIISAGITGNPRKKDIKTK